jgi:uncharacterized protein (TIGR03086 family)
MDLTEAFERAAERTGELVAATRADQLGATTPCKQWTAGELVNHLVGGLYLFAGAAAGEPLPDLSGPAPDFSAGDAAAAHREAAKAAGAVFVSEGLGERMAALPFGTLPAAMVPGIACFEQIVHGWDLARATSQATAMPVEVVDALLPFAEQLLANAPRDGVAFAEALPAPAGATALERLIALTGRQL